MKFSKRSAFYLVTFNLRPHILFTLILRLIGYSYNLTNMMNKILVNVLTKPNKNHSFVNKTHFVIILLNKSVTRA